MDIRPEAESRGDARCEEECPARLKLKEARIRWGNEQTPVVRKRRRRCALPAHSTTLARGVGAASRLVIRAETVIIAAVRRLSTIWLLLALVASATASEWKLVWADEFDKPGAPDPAKWEYEEGFIRNNEAQYYRRECAENARVEDGMLIIEARKEQIKNPRFDPKAQGRGTGRRNREFANYTSASLTTRGKASWTYGRREVRARLPSGRGTWPAIWMLGTNIHDAGWPACGETDIMEHVGYDPGVIHANIHTRKYNHVLKTGKGSEITIPDASRAFHVYALEWNKDHMDFFVDDKKYFTYRPGRLAVRQRPIPDFEPGDRR